MKIAEKLLILPKKKENKYKFQAIILEEKPSKNSYNGYILGRKLSDWVAYACNSLSVKKLQYDSKTNIVEFVKEHIDNAFDYTILLLSKTPLIQVETISNIIEYCSVKDCELCKLPVGYVVDNIAIRTKDISVDCLYSQNFDDFYIVENKSQYVYAEEVWQNRINNFHITNGVEIVKPKSVLIEPEVDIESGVTIYSGNVLKGQTIIKNGVILKENNVINNSYIDKECCISGSVITSSRLGSNVYISAFCEVDNSSIGDECMLGGSCKILNTIIKGGTKVSPNSVIGVSNDSDSGAGQSR